MDNTTLIPYFIAVTCWPPSCWQAFILIAMYLAVRKTSAPGGNRLANDVHQQSPAHGGKSPNKMLAGKVRAQD